VSAINTQGKYKELIVHGFEGSVPNQHVSNLGKLLEAQNIHELDNIALEKKYGKWT
jgi:hypothetical protein